MKHQREADVAGQVTAIMEPDDHPIRRAVYTPADGVPIVRSDDDPAFIEDTLPRSPRSAVDGPPASPLAPGSAPTASGADAPAGTEPGDEFPEATVPFTPAEHDEIVPDSRTEAERGYPLPPQRGSLDDDVLVPLVERHASDTATIDLIGIVQAQMQLRLTEARAFAAWEAQVQRVGTEEALDELERTRLHFTGVIPVHTGPTPAAAPLALGNAAVPAESPAADAVAEPVAEPVADASHSAEIVTPSEIVRVDQAPTGEALVPQRVLPPVVAAPITPVGTVPDPSTSTNAHVERARLSDEELLDEPGTTTRHTASVASRRNSALQPGLLTRVAVIAVSVVAAVVIAAAVLAATSGAASVLAAAAATAAVVAAAWLGVAAARAATAHSASVARGPLCVVSGLAAGTALGLGLATSTAAGFGWLGYLLRLVPVTGVGPLAALTLGLAVSVVAAFAVAVAVAPRAPRVGR